MRQTNRLPLQRTVYNLVALNFINRAINAAPSSCAGTSSCSRAMLRSSIHGNMQALGKTLFIIGLAIAALGALLYVLRGVPFPGRLPGDILVQKKNFTFYFPLGTSLLLSLLLSAILYFLSRR
jgi:hypothetical protein